MPTKNVSTVHPVVTQQEVVAQQEKQHNPPNCLPNSKGGRKKTTPKKKNVKKTTLTVPKNFKPRTTHFRALYNRLLNRPDPCDVIHVVADPKIFEADALDFYVEPQEIISLMTQRYLDVAIIAWFMM